MSYHNWLKIISKNTDKIQVGKVSRQSIDKKTASVGSPSKGGVRQTPILEQQQATAKILVVGDGSFSAKLTDYAITMGQRLDCEIVALSVFDNQNKNKGELDEHEKSLFFERSKLDAEWFANKAANYGGVKFTQLSRIGQRAAVIDQVVKEISGIRYVLTEPEAEIEEENGERAQLSVIDTADKKLQNID